MRLFRFGWQLQFGAGRVRTGLRIELVSWGRKVFNLSILVFYFSWLASLAAIMRGMSSETEYPPETTEECPPKHHPV
jgi:hypothetical protein